MNTIDSMGIFNNNAQILIAEPDKQSDSNRSAKGVTGELSTCA